MESINQQLQIGIPNRDVNLVNRYARGLNSVQPQLMSEDPDLDYYNDTQSIDEVLYGVSPYRDVNIGNDWVAASGDRDISEEMYEATEEYSEFVVNLFIASKLGLSYPICLKADCKQCKSECKKSAGKWRKGGKECFKACTERLDQEFADSLSPKKDAPIIPPTPPPTDGKAMSAGAKIGIGLAVVAALGVVGYMVVRNK